MPGIKTVVFALLFLAAPAWAAENEACSKPSSVSDVRFSLAVKDNRTVFQEGEIIPLLLSFTSTSKDRYWADVRTYDRGGRLETEYYCTEPEVRDPLASYFAYGALMGGGLGTTQALGKTPFTAEAELNEWRSPGPGHYRLYAISNRVWRVPDAREETSYAHISETVRSNVVEFEVLPADPKWQSEQFQSAVQGLAGPAASDDVHRAARRLRFLNTADSTKQLARLFWGLNQQPTGWDLMLGLYGSPNRQLAIDAMRAELAAPGHAITGEFLKTLVNLQITADPSWNPPSWDAAHPEAAEAFRERRDARIQELMKAEIQSTVAALPRKSGSARALTLNGLLMNAGEDPELTRAVRPALIAAWKDLPAETQQELIQFRWSLIAGPEMLPILRSIAEAPPPPNRTNPAMTRDAALMHIYEIDPAVGRTLILRDLQNVNVQPSMEVVKLLAPEDIAIVLHPALARIGQNDARELDYALLDHYADAGALTLVQKVFEERLGKWSCQPQSAMLRYFLRVAPAYGAKEVEASLSARKDTHCYSQLLQSLGDQLPLVQPSAIAALDDPDPELVQDAVLALGRWGSADAEAALWARLRRFHEEWTGREGQLRMTPDYRSPGARGAALEQGLVLAIAGGSNWICPPDKLSRLAELVLTTSQRQQIETWTKEWKQDSASINPSWFPEDHPTFAVLQYAQLTEEQFRKKLEQFPRGTRLTWQFWQPGEITPPVSIEKQEALYERMRAVADQHGITLEKTNDP